MHIKHDFRPNINLLCTYKRLLMAAHFYSVALALKGGIISGFEDDKE